MSGRKKLSVEENAHILILREWGDSNREIGRKINYSEASIRHFFKKYAKDGSLRRKQVNWNKQVITLRARRSLERAFLRGRFATAPQLRIELLAGENVSVGMRTVQQRLNELDLELKDQQKTLLMKVTLEKRLNWALERRDWTVNDCRGAMFSDESKLNLLGSDSPSPV